MREDRSGAGTTADGSSRGGLLSALRDARWIVGHRLRPYAVAAIGAYCAWAVLGVSQGFWMFGREWRPLPVDFIAFWSAARMAMAGHAAAAYDWAAHHAVQVTAIGQEFRGVFAWHNPPHALFVFLPFGALPYVPAWLLFSLLSLLAFLVVFARVLPVRGAWLIALGAPCSFLCIIAGQLGFLIAALTGAALLWLDRRPVLAGLSLALLTIKPQFGVLFPVLLAATGRWRVFAVAGAGTLVLAGASAALFGLDSWTAFLGSLTGETLGALRRGGSDWTKLQSFYAAFFLVTGSEQLAMILHGLCAVTVAGVVVWLWRRPADEGVRNAATVAGSFLMTPYAYVYDAVTVVLAAAFLAREILARGALPWERLLICLAVFMPVTFFVTASFATPAAMLTLLALCVRRALARYTKGPDD